MCEKPLAVGTRAGRRADRGRRRAPAAIATVPFVYRFHPVVREARARVRAGALGAVRLIHGGYLQDWLASADDDNWRVDAELGGPSRAFADIGSHWCDLVEFITGDRIAAVCAQTSTVFAERADARRRPRLRGRRAATAARAARSRPRTPSPRCSAPRPAPTARWSISQVSPGRKNHLHLEIACAEASVALRAGAARDAVARPPRGHRDGRGATRRRSAPDAAPPRGRPRRPPAGLPGLLRPVRRRQLRRDRAARTPDGLPTFADGARSARLIDAVLGLGRRRRLGGGLMAPLLEMRDIRKSFLGVEVLHGVGLDCDAGEIHAVVGENGAGKSTLMKVLAGVHPPDGGEVADRRRAAVSFSHPVQAQAAGVAIIFQEFNLLPDRTVAENVFVNREPTRRGLVDIQAMERRTAELLDEVGEVSFRPAHARAPALDRAAAGRRDRQGALARRAPARARRADRRAGRARGRGAVRRCCAGCASAGSGCSTSRTACARSSRSATASPCSRTASTSPRSRPPRSTPASWSR